MGREVAIDFEAAGVQAAGNDAVAAVRPNGQSSITKVTDYNNVPCPTSLVQPK